MLSSRVAARQPGFIDTAADDGADSTSEGDDVHVQDALDSQDPQGAHDRQEGQVHWLTERCAGQCQMAPTWLMT